MEKLEKFGIEVKKGMDELGEEAYLLELFAFVKNMVAVKNTLALLMQKRVQIIKILQEEGWRRCLKHLLKYSYKHFQSLFILFIKS